ncbi:MAG: hypothetical protein A3I09_04310 [Deltaproteobacteria bacterium RIFCSPLOWO2_02_FULL_47_10]|nr:MAG: hypothetical protein A3I09_04310 [Deltaproteobacteria bacterium RIFCSPLOWO2_02_FULL_47_10]
MEIKISEIRGATILQLIGSFDADTVEFFKKRSGELFESGISKFIIDATGLAFIDSMGLGAMISLLRRVREKKGDVKIFGLNSEVTEVFEITRLNKLFDVCKDAGNAIEKF